MKAVHKNLGEVEIDEACLKLDELDAIGDERHVIYEGDIRKVTASQVVECGGEEPSGFTCECGMFHPFGAYVNAHWREELLHTCDNCKATHSVQRGIVRLVKAAKAIV